MVRQQLIVFAEFARLGARDLLRAPKTLVSMSMVFVTFLCVYLLLQWSIDAQGGEVDFIRSNLGVVLMAGFCSIALVGTTVPLVATRERGTLRAFATVPLSRTVFLLSVLPVRCMLALLQVVVVLVVAAVRGYLVELDGFRLLVSAMLGLAMLMGVALLFAARARSAEATQQSMAMLSILIVFASGGLLPEGMVPEAVTAAMRLLPTTWFAEALSADLVGRAPFVPLAVLWAGMAIIAAGALMLAVRRFDWDARDRTAAAKRKERADA